MLNMLNQSQVEAVYAAMAALNNIGGRLHVRVALDAHARLHVRENDDGTVQVYVGDAHGNRAAGAFEQFASQAAFASAYGCGC